MSVHIERLPNEPILAASLTGKVTSEDIYQVFETSAQMADELGVTIYRITDARSMELSFGELTQAMSTASYGQPGSSADSRIIGVIVGKPGSMAQLYSDGIQQEQYGRRKVPFYEDYDEAMAYLRTQIAERAKPASI